MPARSLSLLWIRAFSLLVLTRRFGIMALEVHRVPVATAS